MSTASPLSTAVGDLLQYAADRAPEREALVFVPESGPVSRLSYAQLLEAAELAAGSLMGEFRAGEVIAVWARNRPEWVVLQLGVALAGLVLVPVNPSFGVDEAAFVLRDVHAAGLFHDRADDASRSMCRAVGVRVERRLIEAAAEWPTSSAGRRGVHPTDIAQVQYTSGTTGRPKGALLTHAGLTTTPVIASRNLALSDPARWLNVTPLFHIGGCVLPTMGCLALTATHVLGERYQVDRVLSVLTDERITFFGGVPTMLLDLLDRFDSGQHDVSALEVLMSGGAPVAPALVRRAQRTFGARLVIAYGQTEAHGHISQTRIDGASEPSDFESADSADAAMSIGRPLAHTTVRIVRPDGTDADPDEAGELLCRSTTLMRGYLGLPQATASALDADGWLHTGDVCRSDCTGALSFVGRRSEMINRGGEKVAPGEVEAVIGAHPGVERVAVAGVPDDRLGQRVAAFVVRADGGVDGGLDAAELDQYVRAKLARYKVPEVWRFLAELPVATSGKIAKADLVRSWQDETGQ